ncbi:MAG: hypothetical protein CBB97_25465 [Candidatus Endolissoclinum sp. TMED37]|nr:MAG: hypothetical protein CBB97_25465 [Candidatus Endolissoclinum sp. TMED37]|tara:strand:- start:60 stop:524 length:465 start_codon:yes stop_codon:yes gene_type:complete
MNEEYDEEVATHPDQTGFGFETLDSGERKVFESGMARDTNKGKARFDLLLPKGVRYEEQMLTRLAELMTRGADKYGDRNWEEAEGAEEMARFKESAFRHFIQWMSNDLEEDHASAVMFNIIAYETTWIKHWNGNDYPLEDEIEDMERWWRDANG